MFPSMYFSVLIDFLCILFVFSISGLVKLFRTNSLESKIPFNFKWDKSVCKLWNQLHAYRFLPKDIVPVTPASVGSGQERPESDGVPCGRGFGLGVGVTLSSSSWLPWQRPGPDIDLGFPNPEDGTHVLSKLGLLQGPTEAVAAPFKGKLSSFRRNGIRVIFSLGCGTFRRGRGPVSIPRT